MIIDAKELLVGRMATRVAKAALLGETIDIINCDKAVMSGSPEQILAKFKQRAERGTPAKGPHIPRRSHYLVKRMIRGMLPYKKTKGREALARIKCHVGVPAEFEGKPTVTFEDAHVETLPVLKYCSVSRVVSYLGGKQ